MLIWFLPIFLILLLVGLPVFFALLAAPGLVLWMSGQERDVALLYRNVYNGMDSFPLMAPVTISVPPPIAAIEAEVAGRWAKGTQDDIDADNLGTH